MINLVVFKNREMSVEVIKVVIFEGGVGRV